MKKRVLSMVLVLVMMLTMLPLTASAATAAQNIKVYAPIVTDNSLMSISASFKWGSASVDESFLVLMDKPLHGSDGAGAGAGDFSEVGAYGYKFTSWNSVLEESNYFGILSHTVTGALSMGNEENVTITFNQNLISTNQQHTYYVYLWVEYPDGYYIPDNLICVLQTGAGGSTDLEKMVFSPGIASDLSHRNYYDGSVFYYPPEEKNDTLVNTSHVCFASGKWFPEDENNCVTYECDINECPKHSNILGRKSHQYTDNNDFDCNACGYKRFAYSRKHPYDVSLFLYDNKQHWQVTSCNVAGCTEHGGRINFGDHVFSNDRDTTCDCGYTRTAPAEKPETGDITNIPLWTILFFGGAALVWVQLEQRKRQQF